jgi:hypothetical protein
MVVRTRRDGRSQMAECKPCGNRLVRTRGADNRWGRWEAPGGRGAVHGGVGHAQVPPASGWEQAMKALDLGRVGEEEAWGEGEEEAWGEGDEEAWGEVFHGGVASEYAERVSPSKGHRATCSDSSGS